MMLSLVSCSGEFKDIKGEYVGTMSMTGSGDYSDSSSTKLSIKGDGVFSFEISKDYILSGKLVKNEETSTEEEIVYNLTELDKDDAVGYMYVTYENGEKLPFLVLITETNQYMFAFKKQG